MTAFNILKKNPSSLFFNKLDIHMGHNLFDNRDDPYTEQVYESSTNPNVRFMEKKKQQQGRILEC